MSKINILRSDYDYMKLAKFVVHENYNHHKQGDKFSELKIQALYEEEISYKNSSTIYALQDYNDNIIGSIRVLKWNYTDILPLEKIFFMTPFQFLEENFQADIWHIGRFAIKRNEGILPLKKLMTIAIKKICENTGNIAFAECDNKLLKLLFLMGMNPKIIGKSKYHLGSETFPILLYSENLQMFFLKHKHLINGYSDQLLPFHQTGKNRISERNIINYSFS